MRVLLADDHGIVGAKLIYHASGAGVQSFTSDPVRATPGDYVSAQVVCPYIEGYYRVQVDALDAEIREKQTKRKSIERFIQTIKEQPMLIDSFDPILWRSLVDRVTIYSHNDVRFTFMDGTVINA